VRLRGFAAQAYRHLVKNLELANVCAAGTFGCLFSFSRITSAGRAIDTGAPFLTYYLVNTPSGWQLAESRVKRTTATCMLFATGKFILVGVKTRRISEIDEVLEPVVDDLRRVGYEPKLECRIQNIIFRTSLPFKLDISLLRGARIRGLTYEPIRRLRHGGTAGFSGARYRSQVLPHSSVLVFASGKLVYVGIRGDTIEKAVGEAKTLSREVVTRLPLKKMAMLN